MEQQRQHERRKGRNVPFRLFFFIAAAAAVWHGGVRPLVRGRTLPPAIVPAAETVPAVVEPLTAITTYIVRSGDTFAGILSRFGMAPGEAILLYGRLTPIGLLSIFPGDSLVINLAENGRITAFSLLNRLEYWYHVTFRDEGVTAERRPAATAVYRCCVKGVLNTSLSEDMAALGVGDALVAKLTDIFGWDIDFFTDPRKGDRFEVLFEMKYAEGAFVGYGDIHAARYSGNGFTCHAIGFADDDGAMEYFDLDGKSVQKQFLKAPLRFSRVSSGYSLHRRHPILGVVRPHLGIDYSAPRGTPVYAAADGTVSFAGVKGGFGKYVQIHHGNAYRTSYGHLNSIARTASAGRRVRQGDLIGTVGSTGLSTGPHLDYRMTLNGRFINPRKVSPPNKEGVETGKIARFGQTRDAYLVMLEHRFPDTTGVWVLDVESSRSGLSDRITMDKAGGNESKPGS